MDENYRIRQRDNSCAIAIINNLSDIVIGSVIGFGLGAMFGAIEINLDNNAILACGGVMSGMDYMTEKRTKEDKNYLLDSLIFGTSFMIGMGINRLSYV